MAACGTNLGAIQQALRIRVTQSDLSRCGTPALLCNEPGGFVVILDHEANLTDIPRYMAHEIGHALFYDYHAEYPRRIRLKSPDAAEEDFCNAFAEELLKRLR